MTFQGAFVFYRFEDHPSLIVYRIVHTQYLTILFEHNRVQSHIGSFSDILDELPVRACPLPLPCSLPLLDSIQKTEQAWLELIFQSLVHSAGR